MNPLSILRLFACALLPALFISAHPLCAEDSPKLSELNGGLASVEKESSVPRQRLIVRRVIRDGEKAIVEVKELIARQLNEANRSSQRTDQLVADEALRDELIKQMKVGGK